ncbi:MAG: hypothetical protein ACOYM3_19250 [Terrimicrobiaceae bacterium]
MSAHTIAPLPDTKTAMLTLWSSQVAQAERQLKACRSTEGRSATTLLLGTLKSQIEGLISLTMEGWVCPGAESGRIAEVMESDWNRIRMLKTELEAAR